MFQDKIHLEQEEESRAEEEERTRVEEEEERRIAEEVAVSRSHSLSLCVRWCNMLIASMITPRHSMFHSLLIFIVASTFHHALHYGS